MRALSSPLALLAVCILRAAAAPGAQSVLIPHDDPLIHYHGRWDASPGTWWAGSGFKLHAEGLTSLALTLGPHTTTPNAAIGVSVDYAPFTSLNVSAGAANAIPLPPPTSSRTRVVRVNVEGWQNNRINLAGLVVNAGARLVEYTPQRLAFQVIGDSLSAGQFLPQGVDQAWPFLTAENFKAEHNVNAQPGAALSDIVSYGNEHGVSFQFFRTEDTGYFDTRDHNFTTPWDFARDQPAPTHVVIHIGANDASQNVTQPAFVSTYLAFVERLRGLYPHSRSWSLRPCWGWPSATAPPSQYYEGAYAEIVNTRHALGDANVHLVNTTGWVEWADVFPNNQHPTVEGHRKIARLFGEWLEGFGVVPESAWATSA
ncbi:SGNH hydrolase-type esterase domain-containing protein [Gloeopeniophorella convolvens]|nr:SGNH hydrolase-type esterase domain-containing protein [Gloeopeniophorella convolvens]